MEPDDKDEPKPDDDVQKEEEKVQKTEEEPEPEPEVITVVPEKESDHEEPVQEEEPVPSPPPPPEEVNVGWFGGCSGKNVHIYSITCINIVHVHEVLCCALYLLVGDHLSFPCAVWLLSLYSGAARANMPTCLLNKASEAIASLLVLSS